MIEKIFFFLDLIGITPQLFVFNNKRYKSYLSCIMSIIIILFSISFAIYSLCEYLKYENPIMIYTKDNDDHTKRSIELKDLILMFQLIDSIDTLDFNTIDKSIAYFEGYYGIVYNNGTIIDSSIQVENCEFGKNLDLKYKVFDNIQNTYGRKIEEFYCINTKDKNYSLFYQPNFGFSFIILYIKMKNNSLYTPEQINSIIISENNIIDHYNKSDPIRESYVYHYTESFNSLLYSKINYNFQYIKYESDDGIIFKNTKSLNGITFSNIDFVRTKSINKEEYFKNENISLIGAIEFNFNKSNFDRYKRSYQKLPSLLAEIMSVISLLLAIGKQISLLLCEKNMSYDIIDNLLNKNENKKYILRHPNFRIKNIIFNDLKKESFISEKEKIKNELSEKKNNNDKKEKKNNYNELNKSKDFNVSKDLINNIIEAKSKIKNKINYFHIIKSFFCFKDNRTKLINLYHEIIFEDFSVEKMLERFYILENMSHLISKKAREKGKFKPNKKFKEINECIQNLNKFKKKNLYNEGNNKIESYLYSSINKNLK